MLDCLRGSPVAGVKLNMILPDFPCLYSIDWIKKERESFFSLFQQKSHIYFRRCSSEILVVFVALILLAINCHFVNEMTSSKINNRMEEMTDSLLRKKEKRSTYKSEKTAYFQLLAAESLAKQINDFIVTFQRIPKPTVWNRLSFFATSQSLLKCDSINQLNSAPRTTKH